MSLYSIWILEYCHMPEMAAAHFVYGRHGGSPAKMPFGYILLSNGDRRILIDCGYDHEGHGNRLTSAFGIKNWHSPAQVLGQVGVRPEDITDVIISHAHFDHMGALGRFPNATFYLQKRELDRWIWAMSLDRKFRWMMGSVDPADVLLAVELARRGSLVLVDGDRDDVLPGVDLRLAADSHTAGSQYVVIRNDGVGESRDRYVCAGDLVYTLDNLDGGTPDDPQYIPVGYALDSQTNLLLAMDAIMTAAMGDKKRVLSVHEERMADLYPSRRSDLGLDIIEVALAPGARSRVH